MPESIERIVRGFSVLRFLSIATVLLILACLIISASIALADVPISSKLGASDQSAVSVDAVVTRDIYEFDFETEIVPNAEFEEFITH
jgi:hypothetical protein